MAGLADLFTGLFGGTKPPPPLEPDRLPPLARGRLLDYATGMELPPLARRPATPLSPEGGPALPPLAGARLPDRDMFDMTPMTPPNLVGDVYAPENMSASRQQVPVQQLPDAPTPSLPDMLTQQRKDGRAPWIETLPQWRKQAGLNNPQTQHFTGTDPEGRPISSLFHAGTVDGRNMPMTPQATRNLANALSAVMPAGGGKVTSNVRYPDAPLDKAPAGVAGRTFPGWDPDAPMGMESSQIPIGGHTSLATERHETGHELHQRMLPALRGKDDLRFDPLENAETLIAMAKDFTGNPNLALDQMRKFSHAKDIDAMTYDAKKYKFPVDANYIAYARTPSERFAEAFRGYTENPEKFKRDYPDAAAFLRSVINTNPRTNKLMTLSKNDLGRTLASGVG